MTDPETEAGLPVTKAELQAMRDWQPHRFEDVRSKLERLRRRLSYALESGAIDDVTHWEIWGVASERVHAVLKQLNEAPLPPPPRAREES